mgnify:CR=1 FL=1
MSVWLTPDLKPFYGGTYFPPTSRWGRPGFVEILQEIARVWSAERDKVVQSAESLTNQLRAGGALRRPALPRCPGAEALARTVSPVSSIVRLAGTAGSATPRSFRGRASCCSSLREHARTGDE